MAMLFMDGFDKYGPPGQATPTPTSLMSAEWNSALTVGIVAGLSATGQAVSISSNTVLSKTLPNTSRIIGGVRIQPLTLANPLGLTCFDSGTAQFSIRVNANGTIALVSGNLTGTAIATSVGSISLNSIHYLEWDVAIGTSGAYNVYLDGVSILSGTGNTRNGTANSYVNALTFGSSLSSTANLDDFYLFDSTGSTNNAVLLNNPIVETALPSGDAQKQWAAGATIIGNDNSLTNSTSQPGANQLFLRQFTAPCNLTLNSISCVPSVTNGAAKFRPAIYGAPGPTGAHRYWRVFNNSTGGATSSIAEIQFRTTAGTPLLFSGGTATVNTGTAASAIDNNPATVWTGISSTGNYFQYDYGAGVTTTIAEVMLQAGAVTQAGAWLNFDLQYSDDGANWFEVANFTATTWTGGQIQLFQVASRPVVPGSPGSTLIATGNEVTGATAGATLTATLTTPQSLTGGASYLIGFITDTALSLSLQDLTTVGIRLANTYTNGAPATLSATTTGLSSWQIWGNGSGASVNYASLTNNPAIDDIAYVSSSTVGQEDLYSFPTLSSNPASIACVAYKARAKRSDAGTRSIDVRCASGSADSAGSASGFVPGSSFGWADTYFPNDPNTGLPWTGSAVNAATAGPRTAS